MHKYVAPPIGVGEATDVGRRRHENQDSMGYAQLDRFAYKGAHLLITADGMGGASGGQQASSTAVEKILEYFQQGHPSPEPDIAIREAVESAAEAVQAKAQEDPRLEGMGTTCVVVIIHNGYLFAGHIGDSRLYMLHKGELLRLSRDHSRVQFMVEAGIISEEDAKRHPHQNFLARVLGSNQQPRVEILAPPRKLELGDRLLLCSDGLYNEVSDEEIKQVLGTYEPQKAADTLLEMANENGGNDNITVQILTYGEAQEPMVAESWFRFSSATAGFAFTLFCFGLIFLSGFFVGRYNQAISQSPNTAGLSSLQPQDRPNPCIAPDGADRCQNATDDADGDDDIDGDDNADASSPTAPTTTPDAPVVTATPDATVGTPTPDAPAVQPTPTPDASVVQPTRTPDAIVVKPTPAPDTSVVKPTPAPDTPTVKPTPPGPDAPVLAPTPDVPVLVPAPDTRGTQVTDKSATTQLPATRPTTKPATQPTTKPTTLRP